MNNAHTPAVFGMTVQQIGHSNEYVIVDVRDRWEPRIVGRAFGRFYAMVLRNIIAGYGEDTAAKLARIETSLTA